MGTVSGNCLRGLTAEGARQGSYGRNTRSVRAFFTPGYYIDPAFLIEPYEVRLIQFVHAAASGRAAKDMTRAMSGSLFVGHQRPTAVRRLRFC